jgi:hypothetical protein
MITMTSARRYHPGISLVARRRTEGSGNGKLVLNYLANSVQRSRGFLCRKTKAPGTSAILAAAMGSITSSLQPSDIGLV